MRLITALASSLLAALMAASPAAEPRDEDAYARIDSIHGDLPGFHSAADSLAEAMREGDAATVAELALYPLAVEANGELYEIFEANDLVANFEHLIPRELRKAVSSFSPAQLIVTSEGVGFAQGGLWMTNLCLDPACSDTRWAIIRINELDAADPEEAAPLSPADAEGFPMPAGSWGGRLRAGPGTDYPQTGSLAEGERVLLLERTAVMRDGYPWFLVELADGRTGYQWGGILCGLEQPVPGAFEICDR